MPVYRPRLGHRPLHGLDHASDPGQSGLHRNPKTDSLTTRPLYLNRALCSPLEGLLAVAGTVPHNRYDVILTNEDIEPIDFDLKADLIGIPAMTSYVNRGYEIADAFRTRAVPVVMGGSTRVHAAGGALAFRRSSHRRSGTRTREAPGRPSIKAACAAPVAQTGSPDGKPPMPRYDLNNRNDS